MAFLRWFRDLHYLDLGSTSVNNGYYKHGKQNVGGKSVWEL